VREEKFTAAGLEEATIAELQAAMELGQLTARRLVMLYLERIASYDKAGPMLNSVLEINPEALQIAEALDYERRDRGPRGPLHGIPILLKDNLDTGDKMHTSAGSLALADSYARTDSFVAAQLRKAGAIILAKANMTEWANFMTRNMPNGFSSRGGQVLNPYGPGRFDVGGSSSGSGAAIAANLAVASIGTETSGSILSPASANSVVGIKPTVGLVSRSGIIPIACSQDTAGPLARTVRDAALVLTAIAGVDEQDPATTANQGARDYAQFLDKDGLRGARIGLPRSPYYDRLGEARLAIMEQAIADLRAAGAEVIDPISFPAAGERFDINVMLYEFKPCLNAYLRQVAPHVPVRSLREVIEFNLAHAQQTLRYGQTILLSAEEKSGTLTEPEYLEARLRDLRLSQDQGIDHALREYQLDALLFPGNWGAGLAARAGYPSICVPGGYTAEGQPLGVTFTSTAYSEPTLLRLAYAYEQATLRRRPPTL
jgi:amidase